MKYILSAIILGLLNAIAIHLSDTRTTAWVITGLATFVMVLTMLGFLAFIIVGIWHSILFIASSILPIFWYKKYRRIQ